VCPDDHRPLPNRQNEIPGVRLASRKLGNSQAPTPPPALAQLSKQQTRRHSARQPGCVYDPLKPARKSRSGVPGCADAQEEDPATVWVWGQESEGTTAKTGMGVEKRGQQRQDPIAKGAKDIPDVTVVAAAGDSSAAERQKMFAKNTSVSSCRCVPTNQRLLLVLMLMLA